MSVARTSLLSMLFATTAVACGEVPIEDLTPDAAPQQPLTRTYQANLAMAPAAPFGGVLPDYPCKYTMTLKQVSLQLQIDGDGKVVGGTLQNMTNEVITNPTECPFLPDTDRLLKFTFKSATPVGASSMVVMQGEKANAPETSLALTVTPTGSSYIATGRWTRTDQVPALTWSATANLNLAEK